MNDLLPEELDAEDTASEAQQPVVEPPPQATPSRVGRLAVKARLVFGAGCLLVAAALSGLALAEHARAARPAPIVVVEVEGQLVEGDAGEAASRIASAWEREPFTLQVGDERIETTRRGAGAHVDRAALTRSIEQARDPRSLMRRFHAEHAPEAPLSLSLPIVFSSESLFEDLSARKDQLDRRAVDARIEPRTGRVLPETRGQHLDVLTSVEAAYAAASSGAPSERATIAEQAPRRTAAALSEVRVEAVLGSYETHYSTLEESRDRTFNLRVAAAKIDGTVLMPGETIDFNEVVGERSEANGFRPAPEIAGGELIDGVGGGTCQIAGTLHAAAFFAGLPIVERSPHSRPSGYIWMGLDAVVVYQRLNLRFTNDFEFPVVLGMTVEGGTVRAEIRGHSSDRMVTFTRRVDRTEPFTERNVDDPSLPSGVRVLRQRGVPGFTITRFRIVRAVDANQARRARWEDTYPPTEQIWRVGTGPAPAEGYTPPEGDGHLEYTADELLSASFGAGVEGLEVTRRAGRTGTSGWIVRAGMPSSVP